MTMPTSGRTAMFCEWRAPGFETQKNSRYDAAAYQTGDAQGSHRLALGHVKHATILAGSATVATVSIVCGMRSRRFAVVPEPIARAGTNFR